MSLLICGRSRYRRCMTKWFSIALLVLVLAHGHAAAAEKILFAENFAHGLASGWENVAFFKTPTDYAVVRNGTNCFVRGVAAKTCSALSVKLDLAPPAKLKLRWRWRIEGVNTNGSERELKKFDHAARVFVAFDTIAALAYKHAKDTFDVAADWKKVFPDKPMPKIVGIGVMTDGDSLGQKLTGDYADIELIGE